MLTNILLTAFIHLSTNWVLLGDGTGRDVGFVQTNVVVQAVHEGVTNVMTLKVGVEQVPSLVRTNAVARVEWWKDYLIVTNQLVPAWTAEDHLTEGGENPPRPKTRSDSSNPVHTSRSPE